MDWFALTFLVTCGGYTHPAPRQWWQKQPKGVMDGVLLSHSLRRVPFLLGRHGTGVSRWWPAHMSRKQREQAVEPGIYNL